MTSIVGICNMALSNIGKKTIADINEASTEARTCKLHFPLTRDTLLQCYPWEFAKTVSTLAAVANAREERWAYAYARPAGCLKPIRIVPEVDIPEDADQIPYEASEGLIYCSEAAARLEFIQKFDDPARFPPMFCEALIWALAAKIAIPLTADQAIRKDAYQIAAQTLGAAQMADANENHSTYDHQSAFIRARG